MRFNTEINNIPVTVEFNNMIPQQWELVAVRKHTSKAFIETIYAHMDRADELRVSRECVNLKDEAIYQSL